MAALSLHCHSLDGGAVSISYLRTGSAAVYPVAFDVHRRAAHARYGYRPKAIVALPVCNEADSLIPAMLALGAQYDLQGYELAPADVLVLVLLNGCTDASWGRLQSLRGTDAPSWIAIDGQLPETLRHAGGARRTALLKALSLTTSDTRLIATTDADSMVPATWIARQLKWLDEGCDAILGAIDMSVADADVLPSKLRRRQFKERCYARWLAHIDAWLDPCDCDPWPRHGVPSGASLGFRPGALRAALPLPAPMCGEDRALVQRFHALDLKVRGDEKLRVITSGRLHGRARGGMADTLMYRIRNPGAPCDAVLETVDRAVARARWRARLRRRWLDGRLSAPWLSRALNIPLTRAESLLCLPTFGLLWQSCERYSPRLVHVPLSPSLLDAEILAAKRWLHARAQTDATVYPEREPLLELPA
jgi:hypothetical protein